MSETRDLALQVVTDRYRVTRLAKPVGGGEVFWDPVFRLTVALYGQESELLAVYRITREEGVVRLSKRLPRQTHTLTLDNPGMRELILDAAGMPPVAAVAETVDEVALALIVEE